MTIAAPDPMAVAEAVRQVHELQCRGIPDAPMRMAIPSALTGKVIGKGGETHRRLQQELGAKIIIDKDDKGQGERLCSIAGPQLSVLEACSQISNLLQWNPTMSGLGKPDAAYRAAPQHRQAAVTAAAPQSMQISQSHKRGDQHQTRGGAGSLYRGVAGLLGGQTLRPTAIEFAISDYDASRLQPAIPQIDAETGAAVHLMADAQPGQARVYIQGPAECVHVAHLMALARME